MVATNAEVLNNMPRRLLQTKIHTNWSTAKNLGWYEEVLSVAHAQLVGGASVVLARKAIFKRIMGDEVQNFI
jgi:hypothetical protein